MPAADHPAQVGALEASDLQPAFSAFLAHRRVVLAVSGGPDSTALLLLANAWRSARADGPDLLVATVDHGLRPAARTEALQVEALCAHLGLPHAILVWAGEKPQTGLQEAARVARYGLLREFARTQGAGAVALAHTLDDQAETVLLRLARGTGLVGLAAMRSQTRLGDLVLLRPLLEVPKTRLLATVEAAGMPFARDPSNVDSRFTRPRLRRLAPLLAAEGLDANRLAGLARRAARADAALATWAEQATTHLSLDAAGETCARLDTAGLLALPEEVALRVLIIVLGRFATEGEVELGKAERLLDALRAAAGRGERLRRTLAGALVSLAPACLKVTSAPPRRGRDKGGSRQIHPLDGQTSLARGAPAPRLRVDATGATSGEGPENGSVFRAKAQPMCCP